MPRFKRAVVPGEKDTVLGARVYANEGNTALKLGEQSSLPHKA